MIAVPDGRLTWVGVFLYLFWHPRIPRDQPEDCLFSHSSSGTRSGVFMTRDGLSFKTMAGGTGGVMLVFLLLLSLAPSLTGCSGHLYPEGRTIRNWQICYSEYFDPVLAREKGVWVDKDISRLFPIPHAKARSLRYVWLKARFSVEHPERYSGFSLGRIYDTDKVYVNTVLVGERHRADVQEFHFPRNYSLPPGVLVKGDNDVMIHVGIYGKEFAGILGQVRLLDTKDFSRDRILDTLFFLHIPLSIMAMLLGLFVTILVFHVLSETGALVYVVLGIILTWVIHLTLLFFPIQPFPMEWRIVVLWLCFFVSSVLFVLFVQFNFRVFYRNLTWAFVAFTAVSALIALAGGSPISPDSPGRFLGAVSVLITNGLVIFFFIDLRNSLNRRTKILFWCLAFIPGEIIGLDILNYLYGTRSIPYFHIYGLPLLMLMIVLLYRDSMLETRGGTVLVGRGMGELHPLPAKGDGSVVTTQVRTKLNGLLDYIHSSFNCPVTREELAEKAGLSPDYLSRMFKAHTGLKINDYLSEVRIREACRLLRENRDDKIIDIAFAVGFESLATFNRSFMKIMKLPPTEYRQRVFSAELGQNPES